MMMTQAPDWERDVYAHGRAMNRWPFSQLVSDLVRATRGLDPANVAVLEIGCGAGNNLRFLHEHGFRAAGIDGAPSAVRVARERLNAGGEGGCDIRLGDIGALPWPEGSQDFVIDRGTLTQVRMDDLPKVLSEVRRVLKPGAHFLSYDLFGMGSSDRRYGTEVAPQSYEAFKGGRFEGEPRVTFFDGATIRRLWQHFEIDTLTRHVVTHDHDDFVDERFSVNARRPR